MKYWRIELDLQASNGPVENIDIQTLQTQIKLQFPDIEKKVLIKALCFALGQEYARELGITAKNLAILMIHLLSDPIFAEIRGDTSAEGGVQCPWTTEAVLYSKNNGFPICQNLRQLRFGKTLDEYIQLSPKDNCLWTDEEINAIIECFGKVGIYASKFEKIL